MENFHYFYIMSYDIHTAHTKPVRGVAVDSLNQLVMTSSADQKLKFWLFREKTLLQEVDLGYPVSHMKLHRERYICQISSPLILTFCPHWLSLRWDVAFDYVQWSSHYLQELSVGIFGYSTLHLICLFRLARFEERHLCTFTASLDATQKIWVSCDSWRGSSQKLCMMHLIGER